MMMSDFGVPMSDAEMNMQPTKPHEKFMAESGVEMHWIEIAAAGIGLVGSIIGGNKASKAAKDQANMQNEAAERQFEYDTDRWEMEKEKILSDRQWYVEGNQIKARNEERVASFKDATNAELYIRNVQIRNAEQESLDNQFRKSDEIYDKQLGYNAISSINATKSEERQLQEIHAETAFDKQKQRIEYLQAEGAMRAKGVSGRSLEKSHQAAASAFGQQVAMLNESLASAGRNTRAMMEEISLDQYSADLAAYAQKMLEPGELPMPIIPYATPTAEFQDPRALAEYDFGPAPVLGALASPNAAANQVWGAAIPGIANSVGSMVGAFGNFNFGSGGGSKVFTGPLPGSIGTIG